MRKLPGEITARSPRVQGDNRLKHREPSWVREKDSFSGCKAEAVITELGAESQEGA